jgi:nucleoid DNA-binding protein
MARSNIPMVINLRQNTNDDSTAYGKYFAEIDRKEPINLKGFCRHMTEHGKIASEQMCELVIKQMVDCMKELVAQGQPVKLDGLGTFTPAVNSQKLGKANITDAISGGPAAMINGIHLNFQPENTKGEKLTSKALKDYCIFEWGYVVKSIKKVISGKEKRYQEKVPISTYGIAVAQADPDATPGQG